MPKKANVVSITRSVPPTVAAHLKQFVSTCNLVKSSVVKSLAPNMATCSMTRSQKTVVSRSLISSNINPATSQRPNWRSNVKLQPKYNDEISRLRSLLYSVYSWWLSFLVLCRCAGIIGVTLNKMRQWREIRPSPLFAWRIVSSVHVANTTHNMTCFGAKSTCQITTRLIRTLKRLKTLVLKVSRSEKSSSRWRKLRSRTKRKSLSKVLAFPEQWGLVWANYSD